MLPPTDITFFDPLFPPCPCYSQFYSIFIHLNQKKLIGEIIDLANLSVVSAEGDELFADGAASVGLPLALLGVADHSLHLVTAG